jgi:hypothetical protein
MKRYSVSTEVYVTEDSYVSELNLDEDYEESHLEYLRNVETDTITIPIPDNIVREIQKELEIYIVTSCDDPVDPIQLITTDWMKAWDFIIKQDYELAYVTNERWYTIHISKPLEGLYEDFVPGEAKLGEYYEKIRKDALRASEDTSTVSSM